MDLIDTIPTRHTAEGFSRKDVPFVAGLFFLGLFLFLFYTWAMPLIDPDEPRYASTAREMALNGDWIVPHFNGEPRINKPPVFYWAIAICYKLFGIHGLGARLPSALAAIGTVMIVYFWGKRIEGRKSGFWAGVTLMISPLFFFVARFCITDMLLTFFFSSALYLFFVEYREARKKNSRRLLLYFLLSMVFLVKGPVGVLLFIIITSCFLLWARDLRYAKRLWYLPGFLLFAGVICAWGVPFWASLGTKQVLSMFTRETSGRFVSGYAHPEPFYYYVPAFMMGFFPWSAFVFVPIVSLFKKSAGMPPEKKKETCFLVSWMVISLVFFSLSKSKLMTYILPLSPSVVLLILPLSRLQAEQKLVKWIAAASWAVAGIFTAIPVVILLTMSKWAPADREFSMGDIIIPIAVLFAGALAALIAFARKRRFSQVQMILCITICALLPLVSVYLAENLGANRSARDIVEQGRLRDVKGYTLVSPGRFLPSLVFYSGHEVVEMDDNTPFECYIPGQSKPIYVVMTLNDFRKKAGWIQERKLEEVCRNKVHIMLKKSEETVSGFE